MPAFNQDISSDTERRKPMNTENTIMKSMADMLCQQNLITPDEKSRLILLIDKVHNNFSIVQDFTTDVKNMNN